MRSIIFSWLLVLILAFTAFGKENYTLPIDTTLEGNFTPIFRNSIGIGANAVVGDMSVLNRPRLMYSLLYRYQISPLLSIESNIHFLSAMEFGMDRRTIGRVNGWTGNFFPAGTAIPWSFNQATLSLHSLSGDIDVVFSPFFNTADGWSSLRGAFGVSVRSAGMLKSEQVFNAQKPTEYQFSLEHTLQTAIGGNARIEYILPLNETLDIGFRVYGQAFLPPMSVVGDSIPIGAWYNNLNPVPREGINRIAIGAAGLGMFLYLNF